MRNREEPKNAISGTARNRGELFARNRDFVGRTIFAVSCGLHSFVSSKLKIFTDMTENKDISRCGDDHGTTIVTGTANGIRLPATADLPPVVRELVDGAPEKFRMPTFIACMAPLGCLATRLRFHYPYDRGPSAPLLQTIICSEQSGGKSFARYVENVIMARQRERDDRERRREQEYRELRQRRSKNKDMPEAPHTTIVCCPVNISIAQLVKRADAPVRYFGAPLTLWTFSEELATATESSRRAFSNIKTIMRLAYDLGSKYGMDYLSETSYSASVDILYNTMFCTTPSALDEYMNDRAIEDGNCTRAIFCDIDSKIGDDAPVFREPGPDERSVIDRTIKLMMDDTYNDDGSIKPEMLIDMEWLAGDVSAWCDSKKCEAIRTGSDALDTFYKRSSVSAFRIAALCQYLFGLENAADIRRKVRDIYLCMAEQILQSMLDLFGARYDRLRRNRRPRTYRRTSLFDRLPDEFTREMLQEAIESMELSTDYTVFLSKWNGKGFIEKTGKRSFRKTA